jgi:hypothetical protein
VSCFLLIFTSKFSFNFFGYFNVQIALPLLKNPADQHLINNTQQKRKTADRTADPCLVLSVLAMEGASEVGLDDTLALSAHCRVILPINKYYFIFNGKKRHFHEMYQKIELSAKRDWVTR